MVRFARKQGWAGGAKGFDPPRESDSELERSVWFCLQQLSAETDIECGLVMGVRRPKR